ncbi:DNA (cytosine-5-)-methyltransferase [Mesorhizobium sp. M0013]|uniref:DNA (cytosine-5-)-methyltransferase n=1 Tax=Mesorhizobium sp. M0013 TaxID=2956841 RepID=UPI003338D723
MTDFRTLRLRAGLSVTEAADLAGYDERTGYRWESGETVPRKAVLEVLRAQAPAPPAETIAVPAFRFIDLFAGIGGMRRGFESIGGQCVFTSEWDKYSQITYRANFPHDPHPIAGDIRNVPEKEIPEFDVLLAGFPCQPFSLAGVSKKNSLNRAHGFADETQGTLFFDVARIIAHHRPAAVLLENVKNLLSHDRGRTFEIIKEVLQERLGYQISYRVIDGKAWTPQHRERIFIVGFREANDFSLHDLPIPEARPDLSTILHGVAAPETPEAPYSEGEKGQAAAKYTLTPHLWRYLQDYAEKHRQRGNGFGFGLVGPDDIARTLSARYHKDGSEILINQGKGRIPRRLTPRECARLMGFDAPGRTPMKLRVSDTQAYRQFGNAVVVPVVEAIAAHMEPHLMAALAAEQELGRAVA